MDESIKKEQAVVIPETILPYAVEEMIRKQMKPSPTRALVFENDKQRSMGMLRKGMSKPGMVSFEVLRRAANAVPVVRICVNVLKEKITKTKWVIKSLDPMVEVDDKKVKEVTDLLRNPNPDDTFRSFMDKLLEDLLILDVACIEKTRLPDGTLARLYYVDASTIRPVYDEFGNQDVEVPLPNGKTIPTSFLQIFNNSMYGGPESGNIVAAWPKQDMIRFMMHPQGAIDNWGYGLSPVEGTLSVVNNLLSADNYNGSYFDEGSVPPVIIHLAQSLEQRQLEAYREYMYGELQGNFHRPAIMAGGGELKIHSLKDMTNSDMEFMEYTLFLAKLMAAAYGLSPQDIGLTDDVNRSTSETMKNLSEGKGYGSLLALIREIINNQIIYKDFGYTDLEFDWVAEDSTDPNVASEIYDRNLRNGTQTLNEVREKMGELPFGEWADEPMIFDGTKYISIEQTLGEGNEEEKTEEHDSTEVGDEEVFSADSEAAEENEDTKNVKDSGTKDTTTTKSIVEKTLYICRPVKNANEIIAWAKTNGFGETLTAKDMHVTVAFSRQPVSWKAIQKVTTPLNIKGGERSLQIFGDNAIVLTFGSANLQSRWSDIMSKGASWDFPEYKSHITLTYMGAGLDISTIVPYQGEIKLGGEEIDEVNDTWIDMVAEKSVYTATNYKTWFDDRGFGQPFICQDILTGQGFVFKPPVAVNVFSQDLEVEITSELSAMGVNVNAVSKMTYNEVINMLQSVDYAVAIEFDKYVNMTSEYDSEKWRAKQGGSRKYPFYMMCKFIDGFNLNNPRIIDDMKRDPASYTQAVEDLARLWVAEKDMLLGDRRADQYIITPQKRAFGFDYQFKGDFKRWEDSSTAIAKLLMPIPTLYNLFIERTTNPQDNRGLFKRMKDIVASIRKGAYILQDRGFNIDDDFRNTPVMFGELVSDKSKETIKGMFDKKKQKQEDFEMTGYSLLGYSYEFLQSRSMLENFIKENPRLSGGIITAEDERGLVYNVYCQNK